MSESADVPLSVLDMFKIGVGPSSSHTLGPWRAAQRFVIELGAARASLQGLQVDLYGSLAKTGLGHGTDIALMLGFAGEDPVHCDTDAITATIAKIRCSQRLSVGGEPPIAFDPARDIHFHAATLLPRHPNALRISAQHSDGSTRQQVFYSVGGGFIVADDEQERTTPPACPLSWPIECAADLARWCEQSGLPISGVVAANERAWRADEETDRTIAAIWQVMCECVQKGCHTEGVLPGGLKVRRRAAGITRALGGALPDADWTQWRQHIRRDGDRFDRTLDWVSCFALAVNEENAAFGRVVTAPTNGAAGVIPAVLHYLVVFRAEPDMALIRRFLFTASEIGCIFKKRATISAAMGGCQAEIGVSSAMAAAGLTECLGGSPAQAMMAAEIAMEHHLGMTCDPVGGLVQVPCIERNTMGAIKAITACQLALRSDPSLARVSLDTVVQTMWDTARDMDQRYKETADGGLAVHIPISLSEC